MQLNIILYLVGFVRTILVIAAIYLVIRFVSRYILPFLVEKGMKNVRQKMENQYKGQQQPRRNEGEVTIEDPRQEDSTSGSNQGDYVDFEEVE